MKHYITVEGKKLEVISINIRNGKPYSLMAFDEIGAPKCFHDYSYTPDPIMNSTAIDMKQAYTNDNADAIRNRIEALEECMIEIAMEYIQHEGPFAEKGDLQKEWYNLNEQVKGLWQALEIAEGTHDETALQQFARGVVQAAVENIRGGQHQDV